MTEISTLYTHLNTLTKQWFYDKTEIDTELSDVVRTSNTAGLIKNDGTIDTTSYLEDIAESGEKYLIIDDDETGFLKITNGTVSYDTNTYLTEHQDISGKANSADLATVATSGSAADITDSSAYTNLGTSASASQHAINTAIDTKIGALLSVELIQVESSLPTAAAGTMNKMYLIAESTAETNDAYEIYVTVETDNDGTPAYAWEKVDTARIDLSGYAAIDHTHGNLSNDGKIGTTANYFVYTSTGGAVDAKEKIGNISTAGAIGSDSGKVIVTTTSGVLTTSDWVTEVDNVIQQLTTYGNSL